MILDDCELTLSQPEYEILQRLAEHPNQAVTSEQLQEVLSGSRGEGAARMVAGIINLLRQKIEPDPQHPVFLLSEPDGSYRLVVAS